MPTEAAFRLSTYLTLAVACVSLGYAEAFLPEVRVIATASVVGLAVIYRLETRVKLLSIADANKLGAVLALAWVGWAAYRIVGEIRNPEFPWMGWQLMMVALFGPLLMFLMPAKLARRQKHVGDYWSLQGMGLAVTALSGAMVEDEVGFVLLAVYSVCGVWSLTLFFLARSTGVVPPIPPRYPHDAPADHAVRPVAVERRRAGARELARGLGWLALGAAVVTPLYLLTPRSSAGTLTFGEPRIEIGYAGDQMMDLNKVGKLHPNPEAAFEVTAETDDGRPKDDLNPATRWRGVLLVDYHRGTWEPERSLPGLDVVGSKAAGAGPPWSPPDLGPGRYRLTLTVPLRVMRGRPAVLADPVLWAPDRPAPVASVEPDGLVGWEPRSDGSFFPTTGTSPRRGPGGGRRAIRYVQVTAPRPEPDLGTGFALSANAHAQGTLLRLRENPVARVKEYADAVLARLIREGRLPEAARPRPAAGGTRLAVPEEHHEAVAGQFARYLAADAGLVYSQQIRREHKDKDPVEDFLYHSKTGHCERFASALVLMLRSQSIPAVVVLGFRGCDRVGEGQYVVRHEDAHAWAQALISRPRPGGGRVWHWLSLDPNPTANDDASAGWLSEAINTGRSLFDGYIANYTPEQQQKALQALADAATRPGVLMAVGLVATLVVVGRQLRRRAVRRAAVEPPSDPARWFGQLLAVLAAHGFAPQPGQTAREFAESVGDSLRGRPPTAAVAAVPAEWADAYYAARFGDLPVSAERDTELERRLDDLRRALGGS